VSEDPSIKALLNLLSLQPLSDADKIIRKRGKILNRDHKNLAYQDDRRMQQPSQSQLDFASAAIADLRIQFWNLTQPEVVSRLDAITGPLPPEWAATLKRLRQVAATRTQWDELALTGKKDGELLRMMQAALVSEPRHSGGIKETAIRQMASGISTRRLQRLAKRIKTHFPEIYQLEPGWFSQMANFHGPRSFMFGLKW